MAPKSTQDKFPKINWKETEKDLVAEQSGLGFSLMGLTLALFVGLAIRGWVSPEKVRAQLEKATTAIHQGWHFQFKQAYVSFSDGIWPELSVVVKDVRVESDRPCYLNSLIEINEIRLPLSWWHLLQGKIYIHEVLVDEANLSLRSAYAPCVGANPSTKEILKEDKILPNAIVPARDLESPFKNVSRDNPVDTIRFRTLKIHYLPKAFTSFEIQKLIVKTKSGDPKRAEITGRLNLGGETLVGDSNSQADLKIDWMEGDQPSLTATAKGLWREGHYDLGMTLDPKTQEFDFSSAVHHLPLSQMIPLFKKYRLMESDFNGKRAWISGNIKMKGVLAEFRKTPIQMEKWKLEGDLGEIFCAQARIESLQPFQLKPVDLSIKGLNVKEFLVFLNRSHPSPALGELGVFNGTAHFVSPDNVVLRGDYSGLEFIFANRGLRQAQALSLVSGELSLEKQRWQISLDRVRPAGGVFDGKVLITADRDFRDLNLDARIEELSLSPDVQSLMTNGGSLGALSGQLKVRVLKAEIQDLRGALRWDQLLIEGVHFSKPKVQLLTKEGETWIDFSANDLDLSVQDSRMATLLSPLIDELAIDQEQRFFLKNPRGQIRTEKLKHLEWTDFRAQSNRGMIRSKGGWNERSEIYGEFQVLGAQKSSWIVSGDRNSPRLRKNENAQ